MELEQSHTISESAYFRMQDVLATLRAQNAELVAALIGVLNTHDCKSQAGDAARAALAKVTVQS